MEGFVRSSGKAGGLRNPGLGKFFYCIVLAERACEFGNIGLDNQRVFSVNYKDVAGLVSDFPRVDSLKFLRKNVGPFHRVIREASIQFTTIPAKFGQIARDNGQVGRALEKNYKRIRQELNRLEGKVEMGFKAWWTSENLIQEFIENDRELKAKKNQLMGKWRFDRMAQIDFGQAVHHRIVQHKAEMTRQFLAGFPQGEAIQEAVSEDSMVANSLLLIEKAHQSQLEEAVAKLEQTFGTEFRLVLDGPWAPFSFVNRIELSLSS